MPVSLRLTFGRSFAAGAVVLVATATAVPVRAQVPEGVPVQSSVDVTFRGEVLFQVRAPIGTLAPPERAAAIEKRIADVAAGSSDALDAIRVIERDRTTDVLVGDKTIASVTDADADPTGRTRQQVAADFSVRLHGALAKEFSGRSFNGIAVGLLLTVIATAVLLLLLRLGGALFPRLAKRIRGWQGTVIRSIRIQKVELISAARLAGAAIRALRVLRVVLLLVALIIYVQAVLGFFPWTRGLAERMLAFGWGAISSVLLAIWGYLPKLFYLALIVLIARWVIRLARLLFDSIERGAIRIGGFHSEWADPTYKIARFLILALAAVAAYSYLPGSQSQAFKGVGLFLGVLVSFGSSSAVSNVVAGIVLTYMRPFRAGERVQIGDTVGDIVEHTLLVIRVRTIKNEEITIPNAMVLSSHVINYSARAREEGLILHTTVSIGYDAPWRTVHELLKAAALRTEGILPTPEPFVLQTSLDDFFVSYQVNAYTDQPNRMAVTYGELHQNIQDEFAKGGVEIMSPHYTSARDGNTTTIPAEHRPKGYEAPAFRVTTVPPAASTPDA